MSKYFICPLFIFVVLVTPTGTEAQMLITDRPDQTESSATVPSGALQIESGFLLTVFTDKGVTTREIALPTSLFRLGLTDWLELRLTSQFEINRVRKIENTSNQDGFSNLEAGVKIQLFDREDVNARIALLSHLALPTGSEGIGSDQWGTVNKLSISHELTESIGLGYNLGYDYFGKGTSTMTYSLALGFAITDKLGIYGESFGEVIEFDESLHNFDLGLTYLVKDNLQLDFSYGAGINNSMNYLAAGFSWISKK